MIFNLDINIATVATVIVASLAILNYARIVRADVQRVRENDLKHVDMKLDTMGKRIDDIYKLLVERKQ